MSSSREYDDLVGALESARAILGDCQAALADNSLLTEADERLVEIDAVLEELTHRTNGHPT